ncbi:abortive infection family protein [Pseudooceanicola sp. LIPI14-2-Ac024]|uniref:abortive infection family protein n=1 Tax=Pseudooceanicola sp. LIPI14-2-Ac024 TaxID=3344875 RepID=UPI0035CFCFB1
MAVEAHPFRLTACRELMERHPGALRIEQQVRAIEASYPNDPGTMVVFCRSIIETTCKTILADRSVEIPGNPKFSELMLRARQVLGLEKPREGQTSDLTRKNLGMITGGIGQIVEGLGNLRNSDGSFAHGADAYAPLFDIEYAEILARAADAAVGFLFKSHLSQIDVDPHDRVSFGSYREFDDIVDYQSDEISIFEAPIRPSEALYHCEPQLYDNELRRFLREKKELAARNHIIVSILTDLIGHKS